MSARSIDVRKRTFAAFVRRVTAHAEETRGWSIPRIATEAGISNPTIYRWRDGTWTKAPDPDAVAAFCDALDISPSVAFSILWPGKNDQAQQPEPLPLDPDIERQIRALVRKIADPNVSESEKLTIRTMIQHLAGEPAARRRAAS